MTKFEMKTNVLALIEELDPKSELLTQDTDILAKIDSVMNHVMNEVSRYKKIPRYTEIEVKKGDLISFADLEKKIGNAIYQIDIVKGVASDLKADGTVIKILEDGLAEIDVFVFPTPITSKTQDKAYEFELSTDALEIMVYGVAADLLKSDESAGYGQIYANRYSDMLSRLDTRNAMPTIRIEGGVR